MLDMFRDRRTMISMVAVPLLVIPLMLTVMTRVISRVEKKAGTRQRILPSPCT
jgi:ABC-type Na+ efflux pump permease subunit